MRIEIELIGDNSDKYEIINQLLDILLKTSANIGYDFKTMFEGGEVFTSSTRLKSKNKND